MTELAQQRLTSPEARGASDRGVDEGGRTHALPFIFWLLEQNLATLLAIPAVFAGVVTLLTRGPWWVFVLALLAIPVFGIVLPLLYLVYRSYQHDGGEADWDDYIRWRDEKQAERWRGRKIPIGIIYEAYIAEELDLKKNIFEVMLHRNQIFRFCFTWKDVKFYFGKLFFQNLGHSARLDHGDIAPVYDRGNDFYAWFLGESMVYTSAIFRDTEESLEAAQARKLDTVCRYVHMKPGDQHLDLGCGWGSLLVHAAKHFGTVGTGYTLAKEQAELGRGRADLAGVGDRVQIVVDDYRTIQNRKFDKITCVEMAEHVGIKNFQKFLVQIKSLLKDDGMLYLQIAGLRRAWQFEDFVWGLFMGKYVFPSADASCPLGFVTSQAERAGFEVHRVENCGVHYSVTIQKWLENWQRNESAIIAKYGQYWFRLWNVFLSWSVMIGGQGSSTVFMITLTKNIKNDKSSVSREEAGSVAFSRRERFIGGDPIATQQ
jgi:sphingolipid C9-methyltransferase